MLDSRQHHGRLRANTNIRGIRMKKRNPIAVLLLSYITFGIYVAYWLYTTRKEIISQNNNEQSIPPVKTIYMPLLGIAAVGLVALIFNSSPGSTADVVNGICGLIGLGLFAATIYYSFKFMWRYCLAASELTHGTDGKTLFWLWFIGSFFGLGPIAMLMIQSDLNRYIRDNGLEQSQSAAAPGSAPQNPQFNPVAPANKQQLPTQPQGEHQAQDPIQDQRHQSRF